MVAVVDRDLPELLPEDRALFEQVRTTAYWSAGERCLFLSASPMTHSPLPMARLLMRPDVRRAAIVYDFIPHDRSQQYLSSQTLRIAYATCLAWLRPFDHFLPISRYTSQRLQELLNVERGRCTVTGVSVRESLLPASGAANQPVGNHVLVVGGADPRKNPEVVISAHGGSRRLGWHPAAHRRRLYRVHATGPARGARTRGRTPRPPALPADSLGRGAASVLRRRAVYDRAVAH